MTTNRTFAKLALTIQTLSEIDHKIEYHIDLKIFKDCEKPF